MQPGRARLFTRLTIGVSLTIVVGGVVIASVVLSRVSVALERDLARQSSELVEGLTSAIADSIWNLDEGAIKEYMSRYPRGSGVTHVRVMTEFDDVLYFEVIRREPDPFVRRIPVHRDGELIGFVEAGLSRAPLRRIEKAIMTTSMLGVGVGIFSVLLVVTLAGRRMVKRPLNELVRGLRRVASGDSEYRLERANYVELDAIVVAVNEMAARIGERTHALECEIEEKETAQLELRVLKDGLEDQVLRRTRELIRSNTRLRTEIEERQRAQGEILGISGREQERIGGDLHDTLGQQLAGISFLCGSLAKALRERDPEYAQMAEQIGGLVSASVSQTRRIAHGLSPIALQDCRLAEALERLADDTAELFGVECVVRSEGDATVTEESATHLYRIVQEAIHNARRHGQADVIHIQLRAVGEEGRLVVEDNGTGLAMQTPTEGIGLRLMRYRAEAIGGNIVITSGQERGTLVVVRFPLGDGAVDQLPATAYDDLHLAGGEGQA